uniref:Anti-sigma factor antagonist n=1 Tax=Schlesneria paludicola TaxID=360056 RepID=A0A7C2K2F9_9PLAN
MPQPEQTRLHRVYLADRYGDTLVITPRGDAAGFSATSVNTEMATISALAQEPAVKHLLVDLGKSNYFGSVILGSLVQLGHDVRKRGGRIGLCGASSDMQDVLRLMKLEQMWEMFPALSTGLSAVATIPLGERIWRRRGALAVVAAVILAGLLYAYLPRPDYARINYERLSKLWQETEDRRDTAGSEEWARLQKRMESELDSMLEDMLRRSKSTSSSPAERYLIFIVRDQWKPAMNRDNPDADLHRRLIQHYLRSAEALMEGRPLPKLPPLHTPSSPRSAETPPSGSPGSPRDRTSDAPPAGETGRGGNP